MTVQTRPTEAQLVARRAWVNAVRVYPQAQHALCQYSGDGTPRGYCCLGVATHLFNPEHPNLKDQRRAPRAAATYAPQNPRSTGGHLPEDVLDWLGIVDGKEDVALSSSARLDKIDVPEFIIRIDDDGPDTRNDLGISPEEMSAILHEWFIAPYEKEDTDVSTD